MNSNCKIKLVSLMLVILMATALLTSCGKSSEVTANSDERNKIILATPSIGIGRHQQEVEGPSNDPAEDTGIVICIDAGHGFVDGGCGEGIEALGGVLEKEINLAIANMLDEKLRHMGYTTIMTHNGKDIPSWDTNKNNIFSASERVVYVNTLDVDYLVSIHVNSNDDPSVSGLWICYEQNARKQNDWSEKIAQSISASIAENQLDVTKNVLKSEYSLALTRETYAAASLIEIGFATNATDTARMLDPYWQGLLAQSIADGIDDYFKGGDN